jgi:acyl-coenzyme A thioesterase PaaI-like protein
MDTMQHVKLAVLWRSWHAGYLLAAANSAAGCGCQPASLPVHCQLRAVPLRVLMLQEHQSGVVTDSLVCYMQMFA